MTSLATETRPDRRDAGVRRPRDRAGHHVGSKPAPPARRTRNSRNHPQRQSLGKVLRRGPLFQAESLTEHEASATTDPATELRRWQVPDQPAQAGWVFVSVD